MTNAEQAQGQLLELAALRQCLTELALPPLRAKRSTAL